MLSRCLWHILALGGALAASRVVGAVDFVRGDANNDGVVTISDAHRMLTFMFRTGEGITCGDAADADNNGVIEIDDAILVLRHVAFQEVGPVAPFPDPGADDGFDVDDRFPCDAYGGESPLPDPAARLEVLDAIVPGGPDRLATIRLAIANSTRVGGYHAELATGGIFEGRDLDKKDLDDGIFDLSGTFQFGFVSAVSDEAAGRVRITFLSSFTGDLAIPPRAEQAVLEVHLCLKPGTPAGVYPLVLERGELVDHESGRRIDPVLVSGRLTVLEHVARADCVIEPSHPGQERFLDITFKLGESSGVPGGEAEVPLIIRTSDHAVARGLQFSVDFDEEVLQLAGIETVLPRPDGNPWIREWPYVVNNNETPGNAGVDEGFATGIYRYGDHLETFRFPVNQEFVALNFRFRIDPGASVGTTEVRFLDGGEFCRESKQLEKPWCLPRDNALISGQVELRPGLVNSFVFVNGKVNIIGEVTTFVRGDSNGDRRVELSDALFTLEYLFLGGPAPACPDAADANDDGQLDVSDPVATLGALFLGTGPLPPPAGSPGSDPTPDALGCNILASR